MNRTLTQQETDLLFRACENRDVFHYDVQVELVDHLASAIEEQWIEDPKIPFKYALYVAAKKFGPTGFSQIKEQKQKELSRKYNLILWHYLLEFYRWPKMLLTLTLSFGVLLLLKNISGLHWVFLSYTMVLCIGAVVYDLRYKSKHKIHTVGNKSFLLLKQLKNLQSAALFLCCSPVLSFTIFNMMREVKLSLPSNNVLLFPIALFIVSSIIVLFGYFFYIPQKIKEHFSEQFPEFAL